MALALATTGTRLILPVKDGGALAPVIPPPTPAPEYMPVGAPVPPNPIIAPPPPQQYRGEGGTPFLDGSGFNQPTVYLRPYIIPVPPSESVLYGIPETETYYPNAPAVPQIIAKKPAGTGANVTPPPVPPPAKLPVPAVVSPTVKPGPVTGNVGGFDLSRVPLWAWLVGAAVVGARLLK